MPLPEVEHIKKVESVVSGLLNLFERYEIHCSWATVGLLHHLPSELESKKQRPSIPYSNPTFSPFPLTTEKYGNFDLAMLSGRSEIEAILGSSNQELSSHTYSHFYCAEKGINSADFETDCLEMVSLSNQLNIPFKSIVFPRNQVNRECLEVAGKYGIRAYRGNQENLFWKNSRFEDESLPKKAGRVIDAYMPISKTRSYSVSQLKQEASLWNIPANRFFRPYSGRKWLEKRKIRRIKNEMYHAAKEGKIYHLWWHPHNFAKDLAVSLAQVEELAAYYQVLNKKFDFQSLTLSEIVAYAEK